MIDALVRDGWGYHDSEPERLARELEAQVGAPVAEHITPFLNLSNHTIGDHLGDWERARKLAEAIMAGVELTEVTFRAAGLLAVSRFMCGDSPGACQAELLAAEALPEDPMYPILDARMLLARSLMLMSRAKEALTLYGAVANVADQRMKGGIVNRTLAATSNNIASDLLHRSHRSQEEETLMMTSAVHSLSYWRICGTWENEERALYLLALIANDTGNYREAIEHAQSALAVINEHGGEPVDEAFVRLAAANAHRFLGQNDCFTSELARADELAASWNDEALFAWYSDTRNSTLAIGPGYRK